MSHFFSMKRISSVVLFCFFTLLLMCQNNIQLNNFCDNTNYINPASINTLYYHELSMAARQMWAGISGTPTTGFASGTIYVDDMRSQFGLKLVSDHFNFAYKNEVTGTYAYSLKISRKSRLNFGLGFSYEMIAYDISKVRPSDNSDNILYDKIKNVGNINSDFGLEYTNSRLKVGLSSQHLFGAASAMDNVFGNTTSFLYANYKDEFRDYVNFTYGFCIVDNYFRATNLNFVNLQINFGSYFKQSPTAKIFQLGAYYRSPLLYNSLSGIGDIGSIFGIELSPNFFLAYSVDVNLSHIINNTLGTQEIMLTYKMKPHRKCRTCPD